MDSATIYSVALVVQNVSMEQGILLFQSLWLSSFWEPNTLVFDTAFDKLEFKNYLQQRD